MNNYNPYNNHIGYRKRSTSAATQVSAGTLILILVLAAVLGYFFLFDTDLSVTDIGTPSVGKGKAYNIGFTSAVTNSMTGATANPTSDTYNLYHSQGQRLSSLTTLFGESGTSITGTSKSYAVYPEDGNFLFFNIDTGTDYFPDIAKILTANPWLTSCKWITVSSSTVPEAVCEVQLDKIHQGDLDKDIDPIASRELAVPALPDDTGVTMSAPADQSGIGTTAATDVYITWQLSALAANEAWAIGKIRVASNNTARQVEILDLEIRSGSYIVNMPTYTNVGSSLKYNAPQQVSTTSLGVVSYATYFPANTNVAADYTNTLLIPRSASDTDVVYVTLHIQTYFAAAGGVTLTFGATVLSAANAVQTEVTDAVKILV